MLNYCLTAALIVTQITTGNVTETPGLDGALTLFEVPLRPMKSSGAYYELDPGFLFIFDQFNHIIVL